MKSRIYTGARVCPHCLVGRESRDKETGKHWLTCVAYSELRQGIDPEICAKDILRFLRLVQLVRIELKNKSDG